MATYALRRLLAAVPLLVVASLVVFAVVTAFPGDPCRLKLGQHVTEAALADCRRDLGLDRPFLARYGDFLAGALRLDFGRDFVKDVPVRDLVLETLPATVELALAALLLAAGLGLAVGTRSALRPGGWTDALGQVLALGGTSIPVFWLGMLLVGLFGVTLRWLPYEGWSASRIGPDVDYRTHFLLLESIVRLEGEAVLRALARLALPAAALATIPLATITRMTRSAVLEEIGRDYVVTARAKGLPERRVVGRHVLKNALIPVVTVTGLQLGTLLSGAVLTETVFSWHGMGKLLVDAATQRNYPVVTACMLLFAAIFTVVNLVVDVTYHLLDPRLRTSAR